MAKVEMAESAGKKKGRKTVDHLELHPQLGGGHIVKHVYSGYEHESEEVPFNKAGKAKGGEHIMAHLTKHAGLPPMSGGGTEAETSSEEDMS